jgi:hypothetical protein
VFSSILAQSDKMVRWTLTLRFWVSLLMISCGRWIGMDASRVTMTESSYNNLVVAISSETPVSQSGIIIDNIKVFHSFIR